MSKQTLKVASVIFDMDGVITNTMPDHFKAWRNVFADEGMHVSHLDVYSREGQQGLQSVKELFRQYGVKYSLETAKRVLYKKEVLFKKIVKTRFIAGTRSFLKSLKREGIRLGLVTGTSRHELEKILPEHIFNLFEQTVTGCDVKKGKPNPEPYRKGLRLLNIKAGDAVVIENAPFGVISAKKAGIRCFAIETSLPKSHLKDADQIFHSIKHMQERINFKVQ